MHRRVFFNLVYFLARGPACALTLAIYYSVCALSLMGPGAVYALTASERSSEVRLSALPDEAQAVIVLIRKGGPFPYSKDGVVFGNREKLLPKQARGFYTEYTVKTPGERSRGARRIVVGGEPRTSSELYYSGDHYQTFKRIRE
jgi:ribonuclease T1